MEYFLLFQGFTEGSLNVLSIFFIVPEPNDQNDLKFSP